MRCQAGPTRTGTAAAGEQGLNLSHEIRNDALQRIHTLAWIVASGARMFEA